MQCLALITKLVLISEAEHRTKEPETLTAIRDAHGNCLSEAESPLTMR